MHFEIFGINNNRLNFRKVFRGGGGISKKFLTVSSTMKMRVGLAREGINGKFLTIQYSAKKNF